MPPSPLRVVLTDLSDALDPLRFEAPVTHVYNPYVYARPAVFAWLDAFAAPPKATLLVGMNPGPWGMAQTGVPFGEVSAVRDWLGIEAEIGRPPVEHPKRPIEGFACTRAEVSGQRLWGWVRRRFGMPDRFFSEFFVYSYCPLVFMEASGRNRTPDQLPARERALLLPPCDLALRRVVEHLEVRTVVGVGRFAASRARAALAELAEVRVGEILHPSPASPAANQGWEGKIEAQLQALGVLTTSVDLP